MTVEEFLAEGERLAAQQRAQSSAPLMTLDEFLAEGEALAAEQSTPAPGSWESYGMPSMEEMQRADEQAAAEAGLSVYDLNLQRAAQADQADRTFLTDNPVYRVGEGAVQSAADAIVNPLLAAESALGFETAGDMLQARQAEQDKRQLIDRSYPEEIVSGIADSLAGTATRAVVGGLPAVFAGMGHQSYIDAHRQAKKEGKTDEEAAKIARANAAFEVGVMGAFQAVGLGGLETAIAKSAGWQGVKKFAVQTLAELTEEELTTLGQQLASQGNIDNPQAFLDTAVQTIGTMGLVGGSQKIARFVKNPTKKTAEAAGIPPEVARTQRDRVRLAEEVQTQIAEHVRQNTPRSEDGQETGQPLSKKLDTVQPPAPTSPVDASVPEATQEPSQPLPTQPEPPGEVEGGVQEFTETPVPPKPRIGARKQTAPESPPAENVFKRIQNEPPAAQLDDSSSSPALSTPSVAPPDAPPAEVTPPLGDSGVADKKVLGRKRPTLDAATFRSQLESAAMNPAEADALYALTEARAKAAGESLGDYVGKRLAGVEKGNWEETAAQRRALGQDPFSGKRLGQRAFHGSPYRFDKFTTEKIGTGEGHQAYGWGLYFAGNEAVADFYKQVLATDKLDSDPVLSERRAALLAELKELDYLGFDRPGEALQAIRQYPDWRQRWDADYDGPERGDRIQRLFDTYEARRKELQGAKYRVDLKPTDDELLAWDLPLHEQPQKVQDAVEQAIPAQFRTVLFQKYRAQELTGKVVYRELQNLNDLLRKEAPDAWTQVAGEFANDRSDRIASKALHSLGIRGIKYLDGSSRGKGDGNYNYVIFDDADVVIEEVLAQREGRTRKGEFEPLADGRAIIRAFEAQDFSTLIHELGHVFRRDLADAELKTAEEWAGVEEGRWTEAAEEKFARGFERYMREGKSPTKALEGVFRKFKTWLSSVYKTIKGSPIDVNIPPTMRAVYDSLFDAKAAPPTALSDVHLESIPEGIEVDVTSIDVRTGERSTVKQTAREAIQEQDQSLDLMKRLLACLRA